MNLLVKHFAIVLFLCACLGLGVPSGGNLEYEYVTTVSWLLVFLAPLVLLGANYFYKYSLLNISTKQLVFVLVCVPVLAFAPGWLLFATGQCQCGVEGFNFWMMLLVLPASWLSVGMTLCLLRAIGDKRRLLLMLLFPWGLALVTAALMWFFPQKRMVSLVLGFLHGPIYDRWIPLDGGVVWARVSHGFFALMMIGMAYKRPLLRLGLIGFIALRLWAYSYPSNGLGIVALNNALSQKIVKQDIELHFEKRNDRDGEIAERLANDAAFHVAELKSMLNATISKPILIYAYQSENVKKLLFGGGQTDVTDVWSPSIHINLTDTPHPTLRHELVHAVASFVSWHGIGFHPNMIITEGLAMALAPVDQSLTLDEVSASLLKSGRIKSLENLIDPWSFWKESGERSYAVAGSFMRWISSTYGSEGVRAIYSGIPLEKVTHQRTNEIVSKWKDYVSTKYVLKNDLVVEKLSREPGVLEDLCPHTREDLLQSRKSGLLTRLRQPIGWDAEFYHAWYARMHPDDRETRMQMQRRQIASLFKPKILETPALNVWIEAVQKSRVWPPKVIEDLEANILVSDLEVLSGQVEASNMTLQSIAHEMKIKTPGANIVRQVEARLALGQLLKSEDVFAWRRYLAGFGEIPAKVENEPWILNYLRSRRSSRPAATELDTWSVALHEAKAFDEIAKEWRRNIAKEQARIGRYHNAKSLFAEMEQLATGESALLNAEHVRRMDYLSKMEVPAN